MSHLDREVFVHQQIRGLEVAVHDWRTAAVQVVHASSDVESHQELSAVVQDDTIRPEQQVKEDW